MATSSEVKAGLDAIALTILNNRSSMVAVKASSANVSANLNGLASAYGDVIGTINGYAVDTTNVFELVAKAELAKLTTEFVALLAGADAAAAVNLG